MWSRIPIRAAGAGLAVLCSYSGELLFRLSAPQQSSRKGEALSGIVTNRRACIFAIRLALCLAGMKKKGALGRERLRRQCVMDGRASASAAETRCPALRAAAGRRPPPLFAIRRFSWRRSDCRRCSNIGRCRPSVASSCSAGVNDEFVLGSLHGLFRPISFGIGRKQPGIYFQSKE